MKQVTTKNPSIFPNRLVKTLDILTVLSFAFVTYDDTKLVWPTILLATAAVLAGQPLEKLFYSLILFSWLYLGILVFWKDLYKRLIALIAIGVLWVLISYQVYSLLMGSNTEAIARNHWFIGSSFSFLSISALLFVLILRQHNNRRNRGL